MSRGPISTGTATVLAITIAAVMTIAVAAALLPPGDGPGIAVPDLSSASPVEVVTGHNGTAVIRVAMGAANLTECRVYLTDPGRVLRNVVTAGLSDRADGGASYIFYLPAEGHSGYWITDESDLVFTAARHSGIRPFSPEGEWRVVVYDPSQRKNRVDRVIPISGPSSPA